MKDVWSVIHQYVNKLYIHENENSWKRYGFVFIVVTLFFIFKFTLITVLGKDVPFIFSLFIVIIGAWYGGFGPGILATILSGIITYYFFLEPKQTLLGAANFSNLFVLIIFFIEGLFISILSESYRKNDRQKSEFIGVVSHELKNPLTSIKGYAHIIQKLADKNKDKKLAGFSVRIDRQINQVINMVNEMLDVTKIETGRFTYRSESFLITDLVKEVIADQQVTTDTHTIYFSGDSKKSIVGDRYRIGQVIINLISNAIKYSPHAAQVIVKVYNKKNSIIVSVQDFGQGIAKQDQTRIFKPYVRAGNSGSTKGTGIGLFISSQIIKRHKGKMWVESTLKKGSTFFVQLPTE